LFTNRYYFQYATSRKRKEIVVQEKFLRVLKDEKHAVVIFLVNGVKLQGSISYFDDTTILLTREDNHQVVYKHAISTIMSSTQVKMDCCQ
jgi:host factor-I protein